MTFRNLIAPALVAALCALPLGNSPGRADSNGRLDQDQVHDAVKSGRIRPLDDILAAAEKAMPGKVIKVEVERSRGGIVYELKIVTGTGRVREVKIDANTLDILEVE